MLRKTKKGYAHDYINYDGRGSCVTEYFSEDDVLQALIDGGYTPGIDDPDKCEDSARMVVHIVQPSTRKFFSQKKHVTNPKKSPKGA